MMLTTAPRDMCFCPGCSHTVVLKRLGAALQRLGRTPLDVCVVSDIGCIGTADQYFGCHTVHGLHGRATTYAEGIKRVRPEMLVIVLMGDGGAGIGCGHLVHAARRGVGIKILVCNNFNFGMTGGQHSPTTPPGTVTATTAAGATERPLDICRTVMVNGAAYVARYSAFDSALEDGLCRVLDAPGFALVDIWELCVAYAARFNDLHARHLEELATRLDMPMGVLQDDVRESGPVPAALTPAGKPVLTAPLARRLSWPHRVEIVLAGSAGQRIRSAATTLGRVLVAGGVFVYQQDDFPITVQRGHSVSRLIIAPRPCALTGSTDPDALIVLSSDGARRLGDLSGLKSSCRIVVAGEFGLQPCAARPTPIAWRAVEDYAGQQHAALAALVHVVVEQGWIDRQDVIEAAREVLVGPQSTEWIHAMGFEVAAESIVEA